MNKNLSIYLDFMRLAAAVGVVVGHSRHSIFPQIPSTFAHASECVAVFFVLSGFVISYVAQQREVDWKSYAVARSSRMYSVVVVAILAGIILDYVGKIVNPTLYASIEYYKNDWGLFEIVRLLTFTNEVWFDHIYIGTGEPYWSLGFEVIYYVIFGGVIFLKGVPRVIFVSIAAILAGPKILSYLPLWMLGSLAYYFTCVIDVRFSKSMSGFLLIFSVFLYIFVKYTAQGAQDIFVFQGAENILKSIIYFHIVGLVVVLNLVAFNSLVRGADVWPEFVTIPIRWLAGGSFTLYLTHQPIMTLLQALFPHVSQSALWGAIGLIVVMVAALLLAEVGERRKATFVRVFRRIFS